MWQSHSNRHECNRQIHGARKFKNPIVQYICCSSIFNLFLLQIGFTSRAFPWSAIVGWIVTERKLLPHPAVMSLVQLSLMASRKNCWHWPWCLSLKMSNENGKNRLEQFFSVHIIYSKNIFFLRLNWSRHIDRTCIQITFYFFLMIQMINVWYYSSEWYHTVILFKSIFNN